MFIPGPTGRLEGLLEWDRENFSRFVALVCHPHPLYGGTMHNKVVFHAAKAAIREGLPTLRFNFRGVGQSGGEFEGGLGEREDVRAALDFLSETFPGSPVCLMGFSFGSWVGLSVGASDPRVATLVGLGVPVGSVSMDELLETTKPKLIVQGTLDQYGPKEKLQALFNRLKEPKQLQWIEGVDHFFNGKLSEVEENVRAFISHNSGAAAD